jgi:hypothetical protein
LVQVPQGWGRTFLLDRFTAFAQREEGPVALQVRIAGKSLPDGLGVQAQVLRDLLMEAGRSRNRTLGARHPTTLETRGDIASWTGESGRYAEALHLAQDLLPDLVHVLGPDHLGTLITRNNIATWTGECGDAGRALTLTQEVLRDLIRVVGPRHRSVLAARARLPRSPGALACWTPA